MSYSNVISWLTDMLGMCFEGKYDYFCKGWWHIRFGMAIINNS